MSVPTLADIARRAGVSRITVSVALRGASGVSGPVRERIRAIAAELGYVADPGRRWAASSLRRTRALDLVQVDGRVRNSGHAGDLPTVSTTTRASSLERVLARLAGIWNVTGSRVDAGDFADPADLARALRARSPDILILGGDSSWGFPADWDGCPLVVLRRDGVGRWPCVDIDLHGMARLAVARAVETGRRLGVLLWSHATPSPVDRERERAFRSALAELPPRLRVPVWHGGFSAVRDPAAWLPWLRRHRPELLLVPHIMDGAGTAAASAHAEVVVYEHCNACRNLRHGLPMLGCTRDQWSAALAVAIEAALRHRALGHPQPELTVLVPARWLV